MQTFNDSDTLLRAEERTSGEARYHYRLTKRESEQVASFGLPLYSVSVQMVAPDGATEATARDCFSDEAKACGFFDKLVNHLATPIDLPYILEDEIR